MNIFDKIKKIFKNKPNKCYKTEDGELWLSRSVAVVGIIFAITDNFTMRVLTVKRSATMPDKPNRWCLPCGYLDWNETLEEAVEREVAEETGFLMRDHSKQLIKNIPYFRIDSDYVKSNRQNISISFAQVYMFETLPELMLNSEVSELAWTPINEIDLKALNLTFGHCDLVTAVKKQLTFLPINL